MGASGKDRGERRMKDLIIARARKFLTDLLKDGPVKVITIYDEAYGLGINEKNLQKAKQELGIKSVKVREKRIIFCWELPVEISNEKVI
jgi:hypothetical protein